MMMEAYYDDEEVQPMLLDGTDDDNGSPKKRTTITTDENPWEGVKPQVYKQRWVQLGYLSLLAMLSDWICFSVAAAPDAYEESFGHSSSSIIDMFLYVNVISSFLVTDLVAKFGMQKTIRVASAIMALGCWLRSGVGGFVMMPSWSTHNITSTAEATAAAAATTTTTTHPIQLVPYPCFVLGTLLVGAAQPFFQCTPPLLSAQWFASDERATSTAIALNFNQIGIATAFLVGGNMATTTQGLQSYFTLITLFSTLLTIGTFVQFQNLPPTPPSTSELEKRIKASSDTNNNNHSNVDPPFLVSVRKFFATPGFTKALAAFICSISITNIVGAFIDEVMERGGITDQFLIALAGAAFEVAIVVGGILIGGYVDKTKEYKKVTLVCLAISCVLVIPLGLTDHALGKEPILLTISLIGLGLVIGPVQPINAELAVDITYPEGNEIAVESIQQIGGNLISALLVPLAERASRQDYELKVPKLPLLASDIRGDVILLLVITLSTYCFFSGFNAPLKRTQADRNGSSTTNCCDGPRNHDDHDNNPELMIEMSPYKLTARTSFVDDGAGTGAAGAGAVDADAAGGSGDTSSSSFSSDECDEMQTLTTRIV